MARLASQIGNRRARARDHRPPRGGFAGVRGERLWPWGDKIESAPALRIEWDVRAKKDKEGRKRHVARHAGSPGGETLHTLRWRCCRRSVRAAHRQRVTRRRQPPPRILFIALEAAVARDALRYDTRRGEHTRTTVAEGTTRRRPTTPLPRRQRHCTCARAHARSARLLHAVMLRPSRHCPPCSGVPRVLARQRVPAGAWAMHSICACTPAPDGTSLPSGGRLWIVDAIPAP